MGNQGVKNKLGGMCGTDYYQKMTEKYGDDAAKFVVVHKCKELVNTKFSNIGSDINGLYSQVETKTNNFAEEKVREVRQSFENMKLDINSAVPGGVQKLEASKGQMLEESINLNKYISAITELKQQTLKNIKEHKNRVNQDIKSKHKLLVENMQSQCPSIPIYYDMSESAQKQIMKKGQVQFASQIQSKKQTIYRQIDDQVNIDQIKQSLSGVIPYDKFNQLTASPKQLFSSDKGITQDVIQRLKQM